MRPGLHQHHLYYGAVCGAGDVGKLVGRAVACHGQARQANTQDVITWQVGDAGVGRTLGIRHESVDDSLSPRCDPRSVIQRGDGQAAGAEGEGINVIVVHRRRRQSRHMPHCYHFAL